MRCSLVLLLAGLLILPTAAPASPPDAPRRVVSTNLCADQLLLTLRPEVAVGVSFLAADPALSMVADRVGSLPLNAKGAEEVALLTPDLILAGFAGPREAASLLGRKGGVAVLEVGWVNSLADARQQITAVAAALGVPERGAAMLADLDARLEAARREAARHPPVRALVWRPNGYTSGAGGLTDEILQLAGLRNVGAEAGLVGGGVLAVEKVLALGPEMLVIDEATDHATSRAEEIMLHPALRALNPAPIRLPMPTRLWICPGPWLGEAALLLARRGG